MASETERETPSQGLFIGYLALALLAVAIIAAIAAAVAGMTHTPVF